MSYPPPQWPGQQPQGGYPPYNASQQFGYPPPQQGGAYPPQTGYPPQQGGYPPPQTGYPPQQGAYPPQTSYPPQSGAYPPQQYPPQTGYPPQQGAYPPQQYPQTGYPPQQYPPQQYPAQTGYPPQQGAYPPQTGGYPPQQGGYPPQPGYPPQTGGYAPQTGYPPQSGQGQQVANAQLYISTPTQAPAPYDGTPDADALYRAMKGLGTDDKVLSNILATRSRDQMLAIRKAFETKYGKSLASWIKGETSGHYETICLALIEPKADYDAQLLNQAIKGLGTDDDQLIEVICTRNNQELKDMKAAYLRLYGKDPEKDVIGDTSGNYKDLLLAILRADRPESTTVDVEAAKRDAQTLYAAGEGKLGTDERTFINILTQRSYPHLHAINQQYAIITGHSLESGISKETSGNFKKAMKVLLTPRDEYFGEAIRVAISGAGTDDKKLIRIVAYLSNSKAWMQAVNNYYTHRYKHNLANDIGGDTSGWYKKTMQALVNNRVTL